jgi:hypothetical protein
MDIYSAGTGGGRTLPTVRALQPTGLMDLGNLPDYWALLAREFQTLENLPSLAEARLLSARAFYESQPAGHRAYMEAKRYLSVAGDNHEALLALLEHRGATLWAPWSLLRPSFEASFLASWILDPDSGRDRRLRGGSASAAASARYTASEPCSMGCAAKSMTASSSFDRVHQKINIVAELPKLSFARRAQGDFASSRSGAAEQFAQVENLDRVRVVVRP